MPLTAAMHERIDAFIARRTPVWTRWLQQLVRIPSPFDQEQAVVKKIEEILHNLSAPQVCKVPHRAAQLACLSAAQKPISRRTDRYSLVAKVPGTTSGKSLILNAHLDTVLPGDASAWARPPFSGVIDARKKVLHGRGSMDDKAGVAIALGVLDLVVNGPLRLKGDLQLHLVLEDETTGNGSLLCLKAGHRADAAFIIDGTRLDRAINEHAGQLQFTVTIMGAPASVCVSHLGVNAAEVLAELALFLKDKIEALNRSRPKRWRIFPSPFQCSLQNVTSRTETFTVPAQATGQWYVTFCPPYDLKQTTRQIEAWILNFTKMKKLSSPPVIEKSGYAVEPVTIKTRSIEALLHKHARSHGFAPIAIGPSTGTSDLRHYVSAGIPCLLYGPGRGYYPHRPDEYYHLDDLPKMVGLYASMAGDWCGLVNERKA